MIMGRLIGYLLTSIRRLLPRDGNEKLAGAPLPASAAFPPLWTKSYPDGVDWQANFSPSPLYDLVDKSRSKFPDSPALDFLGKKYTYAELGDLIDRAAKGFQHLGVEPGIKVGLFLPNTPFFVISYFAILKAGGTVVNFNPLYVRKEIAWQIEDSKTDILVTLDLKQLYPKAAKIL